MKHPSSELDEQQASLALLVSVVGLVCCID